jgi:hypothetical protein
MEHVKIIRQMSTRAIILVYELELSHAIMVFRAFLPGSLSMLEKIDTVPYFSDHM